jgi:hypothetical protein
MFAADRALSLYTAAGQAWCDGGIIAVACLVALLGCSVAFDG